MKVIQFIIILAMALAMNTSCSSKKKVEDKSQELAKNAHEVKPEAPQHHAEEMKPHWGYTGLMGPSMWGDLNPEYVLCKDGKNQSPVDLVFSRPVTKRNIEFTYSSSPLRVINNGHTIQINMDKGSSASVDSKFYELMQVHFHSPSEHTISGRPYPMEIHFVHQNAKGELAVLAVLVKAGDTNHTVANIWPNIPTQQNVEVKMDAIKINPLDLLPRTRTHYAYTGSLTTPPCTEGVSWNVFNTPIEMSPEQINSFQKIYNGNNRPTQPLNERKTTNHM